MSKFKDEIDRICNNLERNAIEKMNQEIKESKAFNAGYVEACEDFHRALRRSELGECE